MRLRHRLIILLSTIALLLCGAPSSHSTSRAAAEHAVYLPVVTRPEGPVRVHAWSTMGLRGPALALVGDVINVSTAPAYYVTLQVRTYLYGELIGTTNAPTAFIATLPGQLNPFYAEPVIGPLGYVDGLTYEVSIKMYTLSHTYAFAPLTIVSRQYCQNYGGPCQPGTGIYGDVFVRGSVRNDNPFPIEQLRMSGLECR